MKKFIYALYILSTTIHAKQIIITNIPTLQQDNFMRWDNELEKIGAGTNDLNWQSIRVQESENSGYHALKNALLVTHFVEEEIKKYQDLSLALPDCVKVLNNQNSKIIKTLNDITIFKNFLKFWIQSIYTHRNKNPYISSLSNEEMLFLFEKSTANNPNLQNIKKHIVIFSNKIEKSSKSHGATDKIKLQEATEKIKTFSKKPYNYLTIIYNNKQHNFWTVTLVIKIEAKLYLYNINSKSLNKPYELTKQEEQQYLPESLLKELEG